MTAQPLIIGTAGHIDHGKTALVRALTGIDTDRLEQEKQRGISIDIGFAHVDVKGDIGDRRMGIVDVPGHERFIKNMLAGVSGIDLAVLVVAADDSVMPQTREHLAILELLGVRYGIVALTKVDLAEPSWLDLVEQDVRELTAGTFLAGAPTVRTSATTGTGLDDLRAALADLGDRIERRADGTLFVMAVDRCFVVQGLGTVVTGTAGGGAVSVGDELELHPAGTTVRVRGIQTHGRDAECVRRGQRAAINVTGAHHTDIRRGHELASPGYLRASTAVTVQLRVLPGSPWPLRQRARVRLHLGTREVIASVRLFRGTELAPGEAGPARLVCTEPVVARCRQPFVVRAESPLCTIGGGTVLQPIATDIKRRDAAAIERLGELGDADDGVRVGAAIRNYATQSWTQRDLCRDADVDLESVPALLATLERSGVLVDRVHRDVLEAVRERVRAVVAAHHAAAPLEAAIPRKRVLTKLAYLPEELLRSVMDSMMADGALRGDGSTVALPEFAPALTGGQRKLHERVVEAYRSAAFRPPTPTALAGELGASETQLRPIIDLCVSEGHLVRVTGDMLLHSEHEQELRTRIIGRLETGEKLTASEIKTMLDTTRKFAMPICEYLDQAGVTRREGDLRVLA
ncbi:MAG: selenocysteine-specific translation elongation factor [Planctomycetes bacterium]|nr:selenocysteine-specific translation elongation factor [Planctomycetota bacterium]